MKYTTVPRRFEGPGHSYGWTEFISSADLEAAGFAQDGSVSVSARVEMIPRDKLRLELRRENGTASPLLTSLSITLIDGAAPQKNSINVENFKPLSNVDSIRRFSGAHNHQFQPGSQEASVWMDADRLNKKSTSFFGNGSLLVMVGMQFQPVIEGTDEGSSAGADAPAIDTPGDLASMRVSELQHLLDQTSSKCHGCVEKGDYVRRCEQVWQELRRAPATVHVVGSELDYLHESSEYEWVSGPYDVVEPPNSSWVDRKWLRPNYKRRRCPANAAGYCHMLGYGTSGSWKGWTIAQMSEDETHTYEWYHHATSNALLPQDISTPWKYSTLPVFNVGSSKWRKSKSLKVLAGDAGRVAWEGRKRSTRRRTDKRGHNGLLRAACNGQPLDEAREGASWMGAPSTDATTKGAQRSCARPSWATRRFCTCCWRPAQTRSSRIARSTAPLESWRPRRGTTRWPRCSPTEWQWVRPVGGRGQAQPRRSWLSALSTCSPSCSQETGTLASYPPLRCLMSRYSLARALCTQSSPHARAAAPK